MGELNVSILTPAKVVGRFQAGQVQVPSSNGYLGILPGHAKLISELGVGELIVSTAQGRDSFFVSGGFIDVGGGDKVTLLVDVAEKASDIDVERAKEAKRRALSRLDEKLGVDVMRAQAALLRAEQRLTVAGRRSK
ncbi:MAG: synthase epsilon chain [Pseudomonadota bacterium]|jgi:F-type H+-transporting ATPase subunit epsilon